MSLKKATCCPYCMCPYWMHCYQYIPMKNKRYETIPYDNYSLEDELDTFSTNDFEDISNEEYIHNSNIIDIPPELFRV